MVQKKNKKQLKKTIMKKNQKNELYALIAGVCIFSALIVMFEKTMSLEDTFYAGAGFLALVFVPMMIAAMIISRHENTFPLEAKVALLPLVTSMAFFVNWLIMCSMLGLLRDESYIAVLVLTGVITIIATCVTWMAKLSLYWALTLAIICGIISVSAYVWAGVLFSPYEVTGTSMSPEEILHYKTDFVFSWRWETMLAITSGIIAGAPSWLKIKGMEG